MFFKGASHLLPRHKLRHLLGQLPKLFKVNVTIGEPNEEKNGRAEINDEYCLDLCAIAEKIHRVGVVPIGASFVEEVKVFDEEGEKGNDDPLALVFSAGRTPHGRLQGGSIAAKV